MLNLRLVPEPIRSLEFINKIRIIIGGVLLKTVRLGMVLILIASSRYEPGDQLAFLGFLFVNAFVIDLILQSFTMNELVRATQSLVRHKSKEFLCDARATENSFQTFVLWSHETRLRAVRFALRAPYFINVAIAAIYFASITIWTPISLIIFIMIACLLHAWFVAKNAELTAKETLNLRNIGDNQALPIWVKRSNMLKADAEAQRIEGRIKLLFEYFNYSSALGQIFLGTVCLFLPFILGVHANEESVIIALAIILWSLYSSAIIFNADHFLSLEKSDLTQESWILTKPPLRANRNWHSLKLNWLGFSKSGKQSWPEIEMNRGEIILIVTDQASVSNPIKGSRQDPFPVLDFTGQAELSKKDQSFLLGSEVTLLGHHSILTDFEVESSQLRDMSALSTLVGAEDQLLSSQDIIHVQNMKSQLKNKILLMLALFENRSILIFDHFFRDNFGLDSIDFTQEIWDYLRINKFSAIVLSTKKLDHLAFDRVYVLDQ